MDLPVGRDGIMEILPHRDPFLMIDEITECEEGKRVVALKHVREDEPYFKGHYPGNPVMPGVLIVESLAQAGRIPVLLMEEYSGKVPLFGGIKKARFRRMVRPGDTLRLEVEMIRIRSGVGIGAGKAFVDGELACECEMTFALVDRK